jgi:tyrosyl-tRNA synthetase
MPQAEIDSLAKGLGSRTVNPMEAKKRLAHEVVGLLHGDEAAAAAQAEFERVFQRGEQPEEATDLPLDLDAEGRASIEITLVLSESGVVASRSEARRLLSQGALALDGEPVKEQRIEVREGSLIRVGRHRFLRVVARRG